MTKTPTDTVIENLCKKANFNIVHDGQLFVENPLLRTKIAMPYGQTDLPRALKTLAANGLSVGGYTQEDIETAQGGVVIDNTPEPEPVVEAPVTTTDHGFKIVATSEKNVWFDVVNSAGDIVSEKRLRKAAAQKLADEMNG